MHAIALAKTLGGISSRLLVVGCEPTGFDAEETLALSAPVQAAVEVAMDTIQRILSQFQDEQHCVQSTSEALHEIQ
jgi:Ni,Fe-hydrogenase maturation factor